MTDRYALSDQWAARAARVIPGGAQTMSKRPERFPGYHPKMLTAGMGCSVSDVDGHAYIDWICGLASMTLGYGRPEIGDAVRRYVDRPTFSLPHRLETIVAEQLVEIIPCAEQVRFVKTGSEACVGAVRIARLATGRETILSCGFHGWHGEFPATAKEHPGVPDDYQRLVLGFDYNNLPQLASYAALTHPAAIILEPTLVAPPGVGPDGKNWLQAVVDLAHHVGALVIFDEMVTGFRWARAGAQEHFGVVPDLACFGKSMANGFPLACIVGPEKLMRHAWPISGTFGGEVLSLAACEAVLGIYEREPVIERLWEAGRRVMRDFAASATAAGTGEVIRVTGQPPHPVFAFPDDLVASLFYQETARNGVLFHPAGINPSAAHTPEALDRTAEAIDVAMKAVAEAMSAGTVKEQLLGAPLTRGWRPVQ